MPPYDELSVKKYWAELSSNPFINKYFPNFAKNEYPEFEFF